MLLLKKWDNAACLDGSWQLYFQDNCIVNEFENPATEETLKRLGYPSVPATVPGNFELDMEQFSVDKILMVREDAYNNGVDVFFTVLFYIVIVGSILLVSGGIFVAIFFSVKKARRKKLQGS